MVKTLFQNTMKKAAIGAIVMGAFIATPALADKSTHGKPTSITDHEIHVSLAKTGTFTGLNKHETTGGVTIVKGGDGYIVVLENNFSLDGAPAPTLGFGNNGKFDPSTEFTKLSSIKGAQVYSLPASIDPEKFSEFYVWCADFSVPLGVALLK